MPVTGLRRRRYLKVRCGIVGGPRQRDIESPAVAKRRAAANVNAQRRLGRGIRGIEQIVLVDPRGHRAMVEIRGKREGNAPVPAAREQGKRARVVGRGPRCRNRQIPASGRR